MSIEINWETLTTGPDGLALAETIRDFINARFQTVTLPRFIKSVQVHSFEFGKVGPEIEIKDFGDPLPDFYEAEDEDDDDESDENDDEGVMSEGRRQRTRAMKASHEVHRWRDGSSTFPTPQSAEEAGSHRPPDIDTRHAALKSLGVQQDPTPSPFIRTSTPGISGGTSNLGYFHTPLTAGLSGTHTPLAAVAGAHLPTNWSEHGLPFHGGSTTSRPGIWHQQQPSQQQDPDHHHSGSASSLSPPSTSHSQHAGPNVVHGDSSGATFRPPRPSSSGLTGITPGAEENDTSYYGPDEPTPPHVRERRAEDIQIVSHVRYNGDVHLSLTAEILLDYPMPSFVGIPVKLNITGASFDGVALLAYIRKRAHLCFLSDEDAAVLLGGDDNSHSAHAPESSHDSPGLEESRAREGSHPFKAGGLLQEIRVESEIGQRENGKQSLKNVGKVEKFILEQVRRLFEDEFVYPSFWTVLV